MNPLAPNGCYAHVAPLLSGKPKRLPLNVRWTAGTYPYDTEYPYQPPAPEAWHVRVHDGWRIEAEFTEWCDPLTDGDGEHLLVVAAAHAGEFEGLPDHEPPSLRDTAHARHQATVLRVLLGPAYRSLLLYPNASELRRLRNRNGAHLGAGIATRHIKIDGELWEPYDLLWWPVPDAAWKQALERGP